MKASVVIPVFNVERYLGECLDSMREQTLRDIEIVCVDDGSTDGSGAILDAVAAKDSRVRVIHQANAGAGPARNVGLASATGEYVTFCDPDDWCRKDMLARLLAEAERHDCDLVLSGMRRFEFGTDKSFVSSLASHVLQLPRPFSPEQMGRLLFTAGRANPVAKLFRRTFLAEHHIEFQHLPHVNDLYFAFISLAKAKRISCVDEAFYCYQTGRPGSLQASVRGTDRPLCWLEAFRAVRARLAADGGLDRFAEALLATLLGMGVRAMIKLGSADDLNLFYAELRKETLDLSAALDAKTLPEKERDLLALMDRESSPLPLLAALNRESQRELSRLRAWKRQTLRERSRPLSVRLLGALRRRLGGGHG